MSTEHAYRTSAPLAARIGIYRWQRDPVDLPGVALEELTEVRGPLADVGCGLGQYTERIRAARPDLRVLPMDRSPAMSGAVLADVRALPLPNGCLHAALAMHMLYHLPRPALAVAELRRVLRPNGTLLASTNGAGDKAELTELWSTALGELLGTTPPEFPNPGAGFTLEHGELFEPYFEHVERRVFERATVVPEAEPVLDYLDSLRSLLADRLPDGISWADFLPRAGAHVRGQIESAGAFHLTSRFGMFVCR